MPTLDIVGKPNIRYDAIPKADGSMPYGEDKIPAGALHTGVLYTPVPHGKLNTIDTRAAENIPGVAIVITAKDIINFFESHFLHQVHSDLTANTHLADNDVHFILIKLKQVILKG